ncbi:MAG: hypothetical protein ACP5FR_03115 [Candidatus Micrarchaeia archaeon]
MTYIEEAVKRAEKLIAAIRNNRKLSKNTIKAVLEYVQFMRANGFGDRTITKNPYCLSNFLGTIGNKDMDSAEAAEES